MRGWMIYLALAAGAAQAEDAARGAELANEWCARCHDVGPEGAMKKHPPSFAAIAAYRPAEQIEARIWTPRLHAGMPEVAVTLLRDDVDDLVAYILSLE